MGDAELRNIIAEADRVLSTKNDVLLQLLTQEHLAAIIAAYTSIEHGEKTFDRKNPNRLVFDAANITKDNNLRLEAHILPKDYASIERAFGRTLSNFFHHDITHLGSHLTITATDLSCLARGTAPHNTTFESVRAINDMTTQVRDAYCYPWQMIRRLALDKLGESPAYDSVRVEDILMTSANVLAKRFDARVYHNGNIEATDTAGQNRIIVNSDDSVINADQGYLFSAAYNNLKNSLKKVDDPHHDSKRSFTATASCRRVNDNFVALTFTDSQNGIDIMKMLGKVTEEMQRGGELTWPSGAMQERFSHWQHNDYAFNLLTMEDVTNIAFMAHITGAGTPSQLSSGMGLYGTRYLVEQLGGAILYATTFTGQHPIFCYLLPNEPRPDSRTACALKEQFITGRAA